MALDDLLKTVAFGTDSESYKAMHEINASALHEMTKDPHQVVRFSRILRQIRYLVGNDSYSFLFESGRFCGHVEAFEKIDT